MRKNLQPRQNLKAFRPRSLGKVVKPLTANDDLLAEMLDRQS